jgi:ELWxxDGT repeat protein
MGGRTLVKSWALTLVSLGLGTVATFGSVATTEPASAATFRAALVKDIDPSGGSDPHNLTNVGGRLLFSAVDGPDDGTTNGVELWRSEGTDATTTLVSDINPTSNSSPGDFADFAGTLLFSADDGTNGVEPWRSNGTSAGTFMLKDIESGGLHDSFPESFTESGGTSFFVASEGLGFGGTPGRELWRSNGTSAGTELVKDINPTGDSNPDDLIDINGILYFSADDGTHGRELWRSDGTSVGTFMVADINPTGSGLTRTFVSGSEALARLGSTLVFQANDGTNGTELWRSDGTGPGTQRVKDINPTAGAGSSPRQFTDVGGTLFFIASDGINGLELWRSDGDNAGTTLVKDINPTSTSNPGELTSFNGALLFTANDGTHGTELWRSDGTSAGTQLVKDINPTADSLPLELTDLRGTLFFSATDGPDNGVTNGRELWRSDGTSASTQLVEDINPSNGSFPNALTDVGDTLFFDANDGTTGGVFQGELWKAFAVSSPASDNTSTTLDCTPKAILLGASASCLATVKDTTSANNPTGAVSFGSDKAGSFSAAGNCSLTPKQSSANESSCELHYTPSVAGTHTLIASFAAQNPSEYQASQGTDAVTVTELLPGGGTPEPPGGGPPQPLVCGPTSANRLGTSGPDALTGTSGADGFLLLAGNDSGRGRRGPDAICGGPGRDTLRGGLGNDRLRGGAGNDKLRGNRGKDRLRGGRGSDKLIGGPGPDLLIGGKGKDRCIGGPGKDILRSC